MTDPIKLARECGILVSENSQQPGLNADKLRQYTARVRAEALEESATVCDIRADDRGAINDAVSDQERRLDYAAERALRHASQAIRALIPEGGK